MSDLSVLTKHLQENASRYFADLDADQTMIQFVEKQVRLTSVLYRFSLESSGRSHAVIVKIASPPTEQQLEMKRALALSNRPRLATMTDPQSKVHFEFLTLSKIYEHFGGLQDSRFGAIYPLDYLPSFSAIIMEEAQAPNLRQLLMQTHNWQWQSPPRNLEMVFHHAGAWLSTYHRLPNAEHTQVRHGTRNEFTASITDFCNFLGVQLGNQAFFQTMAATTKRLAATVLPADLPLGLSHGDYTLRNILVDPVDRVTIIDTLGKWQTSIYEDIGYFLMRLKAAGPQALAQGFLFNNKRLAAYEYAFLRGYWGAEPIPYAQIKLYEIQALVDYWASQISLPRATQSQPPIAMTKQQVLASLVNRFLYTYSSRLLNAI